MLPSAARYAFTRSGVKVEPLRAASLYRTSKWRRRKGEIALDTTALHFSHHSRRSEDDAASSKGGSEKDGSVYTMGKAWDRGLQAESESQSTCVLRALVSPWTQTSDAQGSKDLAMDILFNQLGKRFKDTPSGFTSIYELGPRPSDSALTAIIQIRGSGTDYAYHYAAMVAGRQMAIQRQGYLGPAPQALAEAWRKTALTLSPVAGSSSQSYGAHDGLSENARRALETPVIAGNGTHLHPIYAKLPTATQQRIVKALRCRTAEEALEFDELMRYHCDRTLALAKQPGFDGVETSKRAEDALLDVSNDDFPAIEGEAQWAKQARTVPSRVDLIGAQLMPPRASAGSSWMRPALRLVKGQYDVPLMRTSRLRPG